MKVVVGLGNPGQEYQKTRHNVGFRVVAELASRHGGGRPQSNFEAEVVDVVIAGQKTLLFAPMTYMNLSGRSVRQLIDFYKVPLDDLLVVCDDMNLELARLRLRRSGSAGGQKGLGDIITRLGTEDFARLRIGIDRPPGRMDSVDYVLGRFRKDEVEPIEHAVLAAADAVELWIREGIATAMNRVNAPPGE
jgi:PTH1 family peptidyl-tRNA hydrolase